LGKILNRKGQEREEEGSGEKEGGKQGWVVGSQELEITRDSGRKFYIMLAGVKTQTPAL
jgi:hypothetical protein